MLLKDYIPDIPKQFYQINFSGIAFNSLKVKKNDIFFAIKGKKFDGNNFISQAIKKRSKSNYISKKKSKKKYRCNFFVFFKPKKVVSRSIL